MIFTSVSSLITVGSGFPACLQAFGLLDAAEGAVYRVHNLRFLPSPTLKSIRPRVSST